MAFVCRYSDCSKTFEDVFQCSKHHQRHTLKNDFFYKCCYCESSFKRLTHYKLHVEVSHPGLEKKCTNANLKGANHTLATNNNEPNITFNSTTN